MKIIKESDLKLTHEHYKFIEEKSYCRMENLMKSQGFRFIYSKELGKYLTGIIVKNNQKVGTFSQFDDNLFIDVTAMG